MASARGAPTRRIPTGTTHTTASSAAASASPARHRPIVVMVGSESNETRGVTLCNSEHLPAGFAPSLQCGMPDDSSGAKARGEQLDLLIERYRVARERRLTRRATRLWRRAEIDHQLVRLEAPPKRVH